MADTPMELAAAPELKKQKIPNLEDKCEMELRELERRQASILSRIVALYGNLDPSKKCELTTAEQDSKCANVEDDESASFGRRNSETNVGVERVKNRGSTTEGGEKVLQNGNGVICAARSEGIRDGTGVGEPHHRQRGDDGGHGQDGDADVETRLTVLLRAAGAEFLFKRVPSDYYGRSFEERRDLLGAASIEHLCKSIVMVNTQAHESVTDCSDRNNSKYYVIVVQYTARLNAEKVRQFVYSLNNGKIPKKRFNLRLAPEEESNRLTGFQHNAVTPFGMLTGIPVILSDAIVKLEAGFFWLGGGEVDLKLGIRTSDFVRIINPFVVDCIY